MFESIVFLVTKITQLLTALKPLAHTALAEYATEQSMYVSLHSHWAGVFWGIAIFGAVITIIGLIRENRNYNSGEEMMCSGFVIIVVAVLVAIALTVASSASHIRELTPTLQLLRSVL